MYSFNYYLYKYNNYDITTTIGNRIKNERFRNNLSQKKLSSLINISRNTIADYELDLVHPSKNNLLKLGLILDLKYICCEGYSKLLMSNFSEKLKHWRKLHNISVYEASKHLNINKDTYYRWESNQYIISKKVYENNKKLLDFILNL